MLRLKVMLQLAYFLKAVTILYDIPTQPNNRDLLNIIKGVIFFGTPHARLKQREEWCRLTWLLNLAGKLPKRFIIQSEIDAKAAVNICEDFEKSGLDATVLSIYELNPTIISSARWARIWMEKKLVSLTLGLAMSYTTNGICRRVLAS